MRHDRKYRNRQFWYDFLAWEHNAHRRTTFHDDYQPWEAYAVDEFLPTRKMRTTRTTTSSRRRPTWPWRTPTHHEATMYHRAPEICPQRTRQVFGGYLKEALLQQVLEASKADENARFPDLQEALTLTGMVPQHLVSLPLPHAPLLAAYEGQDVPSPPSVPRRRHDHPHRVVINPPPQPQPEVFIDLISDDDE
jgi:hypothetical protein